MTQAFFLGQLRLIVIAFIAYSSGKGWLTTADSGLIAAILTPVGLLFGPWLWSIYTNFNQKLAPKDSIAIPKYAVDAPSDADAKKGDIVSIGGQSTRVVGAIMIALALSLFVQVPAYAQLPKFKPLDLGQRIEQKFDPPNILRALDAKLLPDLQYALKMARASGSDITANCYQAWIDIIATRQKAITDDQGNEMPEPNPRIITDFERAVEMRNALQPDSKFMIACSPVANMVKSDILSFIGKILGGGLALGTMIPGL